MSGQTLTECPKCHVEWPTVQCAGCHAIDGVPPTARERILANVTYVLRRVRTDPDFYHHMAFTQSLVELVEAYVALGGPLEGSGVTVQDIVDRLNREAPPGRPRCKGAA